MSSKSCIELPVAAVIVFALTVLIVWSGPVSAHQTLKPTEQMLQCMADCVVAEGEEETLTCKQACAQIYIDMRGIEGHDCMAGFKQCKADCGDDETCRRACKDALMGCV